MIICKNIKKSYKDVIIFNGFSYSFNECGLYILYGVSGSGKTTLLQMLLGITSFDDGEIIYDSTKYNNKVSYSDIQDDIAYISQDSYFIDYLTMEENLLLQSSKNREQIIKIVKKFKMSKLLKKFPNQISGGERQRFSLIGNILKEKKIYFLDEPTSSLDKKNKILFYDMLKELQKDCLIICASHDKSIFDLPCEIIELNNLSKNKEKTNTIYNPKNYIKKRKKNIFGELGEIFKILKFLLKQIIRGEKKLFTLYTFAFTIVILLLFACTNYEDKVISSLINNHHLKSTLILCSIESGDYCNSILDSYQISEIVYQYNRNLPIYDDSIDGGSYDNNQFEPNILSLPFYKNNIFDIDNMLEYEHYYTDKNQIILGYNKAVEIARNKNITVDKLIGEIITLKLPDGEDEFEVVGILRVKNEEQRIILTATIGQYDFGLYYYLNGKYLEKYLYDDVLGMDETNDFYQATPLAVFFKNTNSFAKFYYDYLDKDFSNNSIKLINPVDNFADYYNVNNLFQTICLVTSSCFLALGLIFYYQIHKTRLLHTEHNYSIYEYFGYHEESVKMATTIYFVLYIVAVILLSSVFASALSTLFNIIIVNKNILPYSLFIISMKWIITVLVIVIIVSLFESVLLNNSRKQKGWFYLIKEKSDLL